MSSTGPIPQAGGESWIKYADVLRQQQQEIIKKLTLAQQQAAAAAAMKTQPPPGMTTEALRSKVDDQLTTMTTTVQRTYQGLGEALANGDMRVVETHMTELQGVIGQAERTVQDLAAARRMAQSEFTSLDQKTAALYALLSQLVKTMNEVRGAAIKNLL